MFFVLFSWRRNRWSNLPNVVGMCFILGKLSFWSFSLKYKTHRNTFRCSDNFQTNLFKSCVLRDGKAWKRGRCSFPSPNKLKWGLTVLHTRVNMFSRVISTKFHSKNLSSYQEKADNRLDLHSAPCPLPGKRQVARYLATFWYLQTVFSPCQAVWY